MSSTPAARLREHVRRKGPIPFALFMEEALYGEGGYYKREELPIGEEGDFVTGSSHSSLFGRTTAELLRRLDRALGRPVDYLEAGYGAGVHLAAVRAAAPPGRRWLACDRVARPLPAGVEVAESLGGWQPRSVEGLVFSYELLDAVPVHRLRRLASGDLAELHVDLEGGRFAWSERPLSDPSLEALVPETLAPGQIADVADWGAVYRKLASRLGLGLVVTFDYGYERERLFDPRVRSNGTLACYRRQTVHRNPLVEVGSQDLTAHVDWTAVIEAGEEEGLETVVLTRQAPWLASLGLLEGMAERPPAERVEAMALLDLEGMGNDLRVLVQARGVDVGEILEVGLL